MSESKIYSMKPRVFLIKPHHTIDDNMLDRFIDRRLVPSFDMFPDINLADAEVDRLLMSKEVSDLPIDTFDEVEQSLNALSDLVGVDWIAIPRTLRRELFVAQVDHYEHIRYRAHLYVKHFIVIHNEFTIPYVDLNTNLLHSIGGQANLSELPFELYKIIQANKPEELALSSSVANEDEYEDLSFLDNEEIADGAIETKLQTLPLVQTIIQTQKIVDDQIITPLSLPSFQRKVDDINMPRRLHNSVLELQDYLKTNMLEISEFHSVDSDLAFCGKWNDGTQIDALVFNLTDNREHSAWLLRLIKK